MTNLLKEEIHDLYGVTENLFKLIGDDELGWKPATGKNWLTVGQLVMHCTNACGGGIKGFVSGDWGMPEGVKFEDMKPEDMLPPAEKFPAVETMAQAMQLLAEDKKTALEYLEEAGEERLMAEKSRAPWGSKERTLYQHLNDMVGHLRQHKGQLFYYLKLMDKDVNTAHLWGM